MSKVLVIDDDPTILEIFSQYLTDLGHEVTQADNGKTGLALMQQIRPDLIITDIMMPEMDGLEILMQIRRDQTDIPVIAISGGLRALPVHFLQQAQLFGARYVFEKPVSLEDLKDAIEELTCASADS